MYELTYIINSNLSESEIVAQTDNVRGFINALGGEVKTEKLMEKRRLAYPINKQGYGVYVTMDFNLEPEKVLGIDKQIKLEKNILRHLLITKEKMAEKPRKIRMSRPVEKIGIGPKSAAEAPVEKAKIEEINKKLEELLEE